MHCNSIDDAAAATATCIRGPSSDLPVTSSSVHQAPAGLNAAEIHKLFPL